MLTFVAFACGLICGVVVGVGGFLTWIELTGEPQP